MTSRGAEARLSSYTPVVISVFRAVFGFLYVCHGMSTLFEWPINVVGTVKVGDWPLWYSGVIELTAGLLILVGLCTRIAAFIASGQMAVAYFWHHQPHGLLPIQNKGELAAMFCFAFFLLIFTGGGRYALDARRRRGGA